MATALKDMAGNARKALVWSDVAPEQQALERLEAEITEIWGHINAATYRFLALVGEFDRRQGWALHGLASCAQWLNWQCGIGEVAAREKVRVARALEGLPKISDAFRRGVLSYSKVRAITRIAMPANEAELLNIAEHGTAAHVERLVAKYRWVERREDAARANGQHRERSLWFRHAEDGSMIIHAKLPAEVGALVIKAIEVAVRAVDRDEREANGGEPTGEGQQNTGWTHSNVSAETNSTSAPRVDGVGRTNGMAQANRVREADEATHEPSGSHDAFGAKRADALRLLAETYLKRESDACGSVADRFQVVVHVDQRLLAGTEATVGTERCELEDGRALALETVRRLGCDCSLVGIVEDEEGEPLNVGRKTRSIPPALQHALKARDGGCRFPGCTHTRFTEGHHIEHWANGGETKLGNLITLCSFHHRLVHEGGFGLRVTDDGLFVFTKPDGTRLAEAGRLDRHPDLFDPADEPATLPLVALNRKQGLNIDERTAGSRWIGDPMDYGWATEALCSNDNLLPSRGEKVNRL